MHANLLLEDAMDRFLDDLLDAQPDLLDLPT
jgi:hypothetical protein